MWEHLQIKYGFLYYYSMYLTDDIKMVKPGQYKKQELQCHISLCANSNYHIKFDICQRLSPLVNSVLASPT